MALAALARSPAAALRAAAMTRQVSVRMHPPPSMKRIAFVFQVLVEDELCGAVVLGGLQFEDVDHLCDVRAANACRLGEEDGKDKQDAQGSHNGRNPSVGVEVFNKRNSES